MEQNKKFFARIISKFPKFNLPLLIISYFVNGFAYVILRNAFSFSQLSAFIISYPVGIIVYILFDKLSNGKHRNYFK